MRKRLISVLLCLVMLMSVLPAAATAADGKITSMSVNIAMNLSDGALLPFDSARLQEGDPDLYTAYFWDYSWTVTDGICMPDEYDMPSFKGGETYTMTVLIVPKDGVTGLDDTTAAGMIVTINGERAKYNPECKPYLSEADSSNVYAYQIEVQCPWDSVISLIDVFGITPPTPGAEPCTIDDLTVPEGAPYRIDFAQWGEYVGDPEDNSITVMTEGATFTDGKWYYLHLTLAVEEGYTFAGTCEWRFNGSSDLADTMYSTTYADTATFYSVDMKAETRHIDVVRINNMGTFYVGNPVLSAVENATVPVGEGYSLLFQENVNINNAATNVYCKDDAVFEAGEGYRATFRIVPDTGWIIDGNTVWMINDKNSNVAFSAQSTDYWYARTIAIAPMQKNTIDTVYIHGYDYPQIGKPVGDYLHMFVTGDLYEIVYQYWYCDTDYKQMNMADVFEAGKEYSCCVLVKPTDAAYAITDETVFSLNSGEFPLGFSGLSTGDTYFVWTETMKPGAPTYTVCWYLDAADTDPVAGIEVTSGECISAPAAPGKEGYTFGGWYTDRSLQTPFDPTVPITADTELFPKWLTVFESIITEVEISGFEVPQAGNLPVTADDLSVPEDANYFIVCIDWYSTPDADSPIANTVPSDIPLEGGLFYFADLWLEAKEGYSFSPEVELKVDGIDASDWYVAHDASGQLDICTPLYDLSDEISPIHSAFAFGLEVPLVGELPNTTEDMYVPDGAPYSVTALTCYELTDDGPVATESAFEAGKFYYYSVTLMPSEGYAFASGANAYLLQLVTDSSTLDGDALVATTNPVAAMIPVTAVNADVPVPVVGEKISAKEDVVLTATPSDADIYIGDYLWYIWDETEEEWLVIEDSNYIFEEGEKYAADLYVYAQNDYAFAESVVGTVNGKPSVTDYGEVYSSSNEVYLTYEWVLSSAPTDPCEGYTDINRSAWYHTAADFVISRGLMGSTKTDALTFEPNTKVSRAMVASILYRMANSPEVEYKATFTDVPAGKWFTAAIEWCAQNGLASGKGNGKFDPNGNVTRQELAVFMKKMAEYLEKPTDSRDDLTSFADAGKVPSWAKDYVAWAVSAGLISGKASNGKTYLAPTDNATRAEFASIIMRFVQNIAES